MRPARAAVEAAALAFVRASNVDDDLFVVNFADEPRVDVPLTRDVHALETGIGRVASIGGTALRDAILKAERYLGEHASHERRALLVITDGADNASAVSPADLRTTLEGGPTVLYAVSFARQGQRAPRAAERGLAELTELTGGTVYSVAGTSEVESSVLDIARRIRSGYTIGYSPADQALDGSYRAVRVTITRPHGLTAKTRSGYWATPALPTRP
jgi:Ca-activated chloride channel homolog